MSDALSVIDSIDTNMVARTIEKIHTFQAILQNTLKPGHDFGIIPGTKKPSLLKPGAEKINMLMGISSEYVIMDKIEDYDKGFFTYNVKCTLLKNGLKITEGVGNCNSREKKYVDTDPYSITNTILKMAKKRAYVDASLSVASLSDIFTQDLEDLADSKLPTSDATNEANKGKPAHEQVITFGKHKGKTLGYIYRNEYGYFEWLIKNNEKMRPFCEEMLRAAKAEKPAEGSKSDSDAVNWSAFWTAAKSDLGMTSDQVHEEARGFFNSPELKTLTEVLKTQKDVDDFLAYLKSLKAAESVQWDEVPQGGMD